MPHEELQLSPMGYVITILILFWLMYQIAKIPSKGE